MSRPDGSYSVRSLWEKVNGQFRHLSWNDECYGFDSGTSDFECARNLTLSNVEGTAWKETHSSLGV